MAGLQQVLNVIRERARARGLETDAALAERAGVPRETLARLGRSRGARFETVERLALAVGMRISVVDDNDYVRDLNAGLLSSVGSRK